MRFSKWHALGNDYLLVERSELGRPLDTGEARGLCDRHRGVGADGVLEVVTVEGPEADIVIWNPDGSTAELSGNGTRIAARWLARRSGATEVRIRVGPRVASARMLEGGRVEQRLGVVSVGETETLRLDGEVVELTPVSVGNPHAVIRREPDPGELRRLGPLVERHPRFSERTNVQLVRVDDPHTLTVAVWERGAGETLASGTSAVATAAVAVSRGWCEGPVRVRLAGGELEVHLDPANEARLVGPAEEIFTGVLADLSS